MKEIFTELADGLQDIILNYPKLKRPSNHENNILSKLPTIHSHLQLLITGNDNQLNNAKLEEVLRNIEVVINDPANKIFVRRWTTDNEYHDTQLVKLKIIPLIDQIRERAQKESQKKFEPSSEQSQQQLEELISSKVQEKIQDVTKPLLATIDKQGSQLEYLQQNNEQLKTDKKRLEEENQSLVSNNQQLALQQNKFRENLLELFKQGIIFVPERSKVKEITEKLAIEESIFQQTNNQNKPKKTLPNKPPYAYKEPNGGFKAVQGTPALQAWLDENPEENYVHYQKYKLDNGLPKSLYGMVTQLTHAYHNASSEINSSSNGVYSPPSLTSADKRNAEEFIYRIINLSFMDNYDGVPWQAKMDSIFTFDITDTIKNQFFLELINKLKTFDKYGDEMPKYDLAKRKTLLHKVIFDEKNDKYNFLPRTEQFAEFAKTLRDELIAASNTNRKTKK